jgi:hypothetical protein
VVALRKSSSYLRHFLKLLPCLGELLYRTCSREVDCLENPTSRCMGSIHVFQSHGQLPSLHAAIGTNVVKLSGDTQRSFMSQST